LGPRAFREAFYFFSGPRGYLSPTAHLKQKRWSREATAEAQRFDGATVADSGCARNAPVSADWTQQGERGHAEGCPEQLTVRRSSPWHWTGHGRDDGHGTSSGRRRAVAELPVGVGRAREGESDGQRAQMREGRWASRARGSKGVRVARTWPENARSWARPRRGDRGREVRDG
jgi:hypothetical protein